MNTVIKALEFIKGQWHQPLSLVIALGCVISVLGSIAIKLHTVLKTDIGAITTTKGSICFYTCAVVTILTCLAVVSCIWKKQRSLPKIPKGKPTIVFCINSEDDASKEVKRIYEGFKKEVKHRNLDTIIHAAILPKNKEISNHDEAIKYLEHSDATVVVFGEYRSGNRDSKHLQHFHSLSFTCRGKAELSTQEHQLVAGLEQFPFTIDSSETLDHIPKARTGLANLTLFFVAISLTATGRIEEARKLWIDLIKREKTFKIGGKRYPLYRKWWARNEYAYAQSLYAKYIQNHLTSAKSKTDGDEILNILANIKREVNYHPDYHMLKSICEFHTGDFKAATATTTDALKRFKHTDNLRVAFNLSLGFLWIWRRLYKRALKHYRNTIGQPCEPQSAQQIIAFVQTTLKYNSDRIDLFFILAFVRDHFDPAASPLSDYEFFLDNSAGLQNIEPLLNFSDSRLERLSLKLKDKAAEQPKGVLL
tara:strand:+ start:112 stop:1545 length:1434 start_codon:yes stop_codon:yes gene_type:complete